MVLHVGYGNRVEASVGINFNVYEMLIKSKCANFASVFLVQKRQHMRFERSKKSVFLKAEIKSSIALSCKGFIQ